MFLYYNDARSSANWTAPYFRERRFRLPTCPAGLQPWPILDSRNRGLISELALPARLGYNSSATILTLTCPLPRWRSLDGWLANPRARIAARKHSAPRLLVGRTSARNYFARRLWYLRHAACF